MSDTRTPQPYTDVDAHQTHLENFTRFRVQPPALEYLTVDDIMLVQAWAATTAASIQLSGRILNPEGRIIPFEQTIAVAVAGTTASTARITGVEGFLLSLSCTAPAAIRGQCFISVVLQRGVGASDITRGNVLLQGYVDSINALGYPQSPIRQSGDGPGMMISVSIPNPGAGADWLLTVPTGVYWRPITFNMSFLCSATVISRFPALKMLDAGGNVIWLLALGQQFSAGSLNSVGMAAVNPVVNNSTFEHSLQIPPGTILGPSMQIGVATTNLQVGDIWLTGHMLVEQFIGS